MQIRSPFGQGAPSALHLPGAISYQDHRGDREREDAKERRRERKSDRREGGSIRLPANTPFAPSRSLRSARSQEWASEHGQRVVIQWSRHGAAYSYSYSYSYSKPLKDRVGVGVRVGVGRRTREPLRREERSRGWIGGSFSEALWWGRQPSRARSR